MGGALAANWRGTRAGADRRRYKIRAHAARSDATAPARRDRGATRSGTGGMGWRKAGRGTRAAPTACASRERDGLSLIFSRAIVGEHRTLPVPSYYGSSCVITLFLQFTPGINMPECLPEQPPCSDQENNGEYEQAWNEQDISA